MGKENINAKRPSHITYAYNDNGLVFEEHYLFTDDDFFTVLVLHLYGKEVLLDNVGFF